MAEMGAEGRLPRLRRAPDRLREGPDDSSGAHGDAARERAVGSSL